MGALRRGIKNPFRNVVRTAVAVLLLAFVVGLLGLMVQAAFLSRQQLGRLEAKVRTLIELREAGAFGTGGFGADKPVGEEDFSLDTLEKVTQIPHANHIARIEEYIYTPQIDPSQENAYTMIIGMRPGSAMRAIGEIDYENARLVAGCVPQEEDLTQPVAVVGKLYAKQRLGLAEVTEATLAGHELSLNGQPFRVVGVYTTDNDFGDNHVFIPLTAFRETFHPGKKLGKIFVSVDSVANVEQVVEDLKAIPEADVVTTPEAVSTARTTLGGIAATSAFGSIMLFAVGGLLVSFVMVLITKERVREIGTLKAIGASDGGIVAQFLAEAMALSAIGGLVGVSLFRVLGGALGGPLFALSISPFLPAQYKDTLFESLGGVSAGVSPATVGLVLLIAVVVAAVGSGYGAWQVTRLSPVEAMKYE